MGDPYNKSKKKASMNPYNMEKERVAKQQWRSDSRNNQTQKKIVDCGRKYSKRKTPIYRENEYIATKRRIFGCDINTCIEFCSCCHQTRFEQSVSQVTSLSNYQQQKSLNRFISVDNKAWVCVTCKNSICGGKVPNMSVLNGMEWPKNLKNWICFRWRSV